MAHGVGSLCTICNRLLTSVRSAVCTRSLARVDNAVLRSVGRVKSAVRRLTFPLSAHSLPQLLLAPAISSSQTNRVRLSQFHCSESAFQTHPLPLVSSSFSPAEAPRKLTRPHVHTHVVKTYICPTMRSSPVQASSILLRAQRFSRDISSACNSFASTTQSYSRPPASLTQSGTPCPTHLASPLQISTVPS